MVWLNLKAIVFGAAFLALVSGAAAQNIRGVSALEAQELSAHELADRTLGDIGALVIDVDRPEWGDDPGAWARRRGASPPSVPSALYQLVFYAQPTILSYGMCKQTLITVRPVQDGARQLPASIRTELRYGVVNELILPEGQTPSSNRNAREAECARQSAGRDYFPASGGAAAEQAARITQYLASLGETGETPTFRFNCQTFNRPCTDQREILRSLEWRGIRSVEDTPCGTETHTVRFPRCLTIVYGVRIENGQRVQTLGFQTLRVIAGFSTRAIEIEAVDIRFDSAVP